MKDVSKEHPDLPSLADIREQSNEQSKVRDRLTAYCSQNLPPQVLLLEGGHEDQRLALALFWAMGLNCPSSSRPCLDCLTCEQIAKGVFQDVIVLDGRTGKIKIEVIRDLRSVLGQSPRGTGKRVVILFQAQELTREAANALLKSMEEPTEHNVFVLLAPQRERLLPTLVSRSWVLTLRSQASVLLDEPETELLEDLVGFVETGREWFSKSPSRKNINAQLVEKILNKIMERTLENMQSRHAGSALPALQNTLPSTAALIDTAQQALHVQANPALVLDWFALGLRELHSSAA